MRILLPLALLAALAAPAALAHMTHGDCGAGKTIDSSGAAHVDAWTDGCVGLMAINNVAVCAGGGHAHWGGLHVAALDDEACLTGVLLAA